LYATSAGCTSVEQGRYGAAIDTSFEHGSKRAFAYGAFAGGVGLFAQSAVALVLWYGGKLVIAGDMDPGTLVTFLLYTIYIAAALGGLSGLYGNLMNAVGASERMFALLDMRPKINTAEGTGLVPVDGNREGRGEGEGEGVGAGVGNGDGDDEDNVAAGGKSATSATATTTVSRIAFKNVSFSYPTRKDIPVLADVSFTCESGDTVALVGPSGAGKSTIVSLIQRFYDPQRGTISLGDYNLSHLDPVWLKKRMACVAQEPVLFACSIRDNITYGVADGACTDADVERAARQANAHDFICEFKDGYDTQVGERGVQLSGGQKQRVAIARAILLDPSILLLDEATSALDAESEHLVQVALDRLMVGRTTLVIAHRLSTVRDADTVLVMEHGRIAERGTHDELLRRKDGLYKYLVQRQLSEKSLEGPNRPGVKEAGTKTK
jgi:ABC-type multidrug transport system fused ATPase/permease subunit